MQEEEERPRFGSPELEVKLVCDTLKITNEIANARACYICTNSFHRSMFLNVFMRQCRYMTLIDLLTPPTVKLHSYLNRNGLLIRKMKPKLQPTVNLAACIALTSLTSVLSDQEQLKLIASGIIEKLLILYVCENVLIYFYISIYSQ